MNILINGLGLIGGSIAYALTKFNPEVFIVGLDSNQANLDQALSKGIIDAIGTDLATDAPQADVIFLAAPVTVIEANIEALAKLPLKENVIVTDTGSTKAQILKKAQALTARDVTFIGGHPMAGSHKSGVAAADWDLFRSAFYLMVPAQEQQAAQVAQLKALLAVTNARFVTIAPKAHDHVVALLSHVPHILAASLVNLAEDDFKDTPDMLHLAAGGFRDMTRIASSDPTMWTDILETNGDEILKLLYAYEEELHTLEKNIALHNRQTFYDFFSTAKVTREKITMNKKAKGTIPGFYDLHVDIPDQIGSIAEITATLAEHKINILNIQIMETREDINGVLQLTFASKRDLQQAQTVLKDRVEVH